MDTILQSPILLGLFVLSLAVYLGNARYKPKYDAKEPPLLPQTLPYIGHIFWLLREGYDYYVYLSNEHKLPIYTLQLLRTKTYVINDPDLAVAAQRHSKNIQLTPIMAATIPRFLEFDKDLAALSRKVMRNTNGDWLNTYPMNMANYVHMVPGPMLDSMIRTVQGTLKTEMDQLQERTRGDDDVVGLFDWIKKSFGLAATEPIYGRNNPFRSQPGLMDAMWQMSNDFTWLLVNIMPWLTAREAHKARRRLFEAMNKYFAGDWRADASELVKARYDTLEKRGFPMDAIARLEVADSAALIINTVSSNFWILNYIYLNPALLEELRAEIATTISITTDHRTGTKTHHLTGKKIQENCELLMSTYHEVLRLQTNNVSPRWVIKDTLLADRYLLKKDSVVQIPGAVLHRDPEVWGPDAKEFHPGRFVKTAPKPHPGAYRVFGGGSATCPGRHFTAAAVVSFVAMFVMRFDTAPVNYGWRKLPPAKSHLGDAIPPPACDILVRVMTREGFENDEWVFEF